MERVNDAEKTRARTCTTQCHCEERHSWHELCQIATNAIQHRLSAMSVTLKFTAAHMPQEDVRVRWDSRMP